MVGYIEYSMELGLGLKTKEDLMAVFSIWRAVLRQECLLLLYGSKE